MKLLVLVACLLSLHEVQAASTPAICKNKECLTSSGDTCDRTTSTCGKCLSLSSSGDVKCKDTNFLGICVSSTRCGEWSASQSSSSSGSGSSSNSTTETPEPTQPTQPTQPPQPTQPTQAPPQTQPPKTATPTPTSAGDNLENNTTAPATSAPSSASSSSTNWALYGGIGGGAVLLVIIAIVCCCICKKRREEDDEDVAQVDHYSSKSNQVPQTTYAQTSTTTAPPPVVVVTEPAPAPTTYTIPADQSFQLPITPRSSSSNASLPRTSGMSGYEVQSNPLVNFMSRAAVEESTANYRQNIAQKFNDVENFNEGVGSDSESEPSLNSFKRDSNDSLSSSNGSGDSFVVTRGENDRTANETTCSVEF